MSKDINKKIQEGVDWARAIKSLPEAFTAATYNAAELILMVFENILEEPEK